MRRALPLLLLAACGCSSLSRSMVYFPPQRPFWPCEEASKAGADAVSSGQVRYLWGGAKDPKGVLLLFHGNAEDACSRSYLFEVAARLGWRAALAEYPGYGGDGGKPGSKAILSAATAAYDHVAGLMPGKPIAVYGISLGTGPATYVASTRPAAALILESPWTSLEDVGMAAYPLLPVRLLLTERFPAADWAPKIGGPVLAYYGNRDTVIPPAITLAQIKKFPGKPRVELFEGKGHNGMMPSDPKRYFAALAETLEAALAGPQARR